MRRVLHGDLVQLGRVLYAHDADERREVVDRAFVQTSIAHQHCLAKGQWHPEFGDGSLAGWSSRQTRPPEPDLDDPDYAACLVMILQHMARVDRTPISWETLS